ncbi:MAG: hypothetical protein Q7W45_00580 [Bacteroidota bacterium]|nr:hypothetical protein [Bacteroidota bacterium]MDP3144550.1 hypothetical protein [Bacteroidota bacterium]
MRTFLLHISLLLTTINCLAVRPFITDDARVVGWRLGQLESWLRFDKHAWQNWNMIAYGPTKRWELAAGLVHGLEAPQTEHQGYTYAIPLLQAKFLIHEYKPNKAPGVAVVAGSFLPGGQGAFKAPGYGAFGYVAVTQCFGKDENVLIHGNIGVSHIQYTNVDHTVMTWGVGTQIRTVGGLHVLGEIFSGDPYVPGSGISYQAGFRHFVNNFVQLDLTVGQGISGQNKLPFWYGVGVRLVTDYFDKRHKRKNKSVN